MYNVETKLQLCWGVEAVNLEIANWIGQAGLRIPGTAYSAFAAVPSQLGTVVYPATLTMLV